MDGIPKGMLSSSSSPSSWTFGKSTQRAHAVPPRTSRKLTRFGRHCEPGLGHPYYLLNPGTVPASAGSAARTLDVQPCIVCISPYSWR